MSTGLEDVSLFNLFRMEAEEQVRTLQTNLLQLEQCSGAGSTGAVPTTVPLLEALMRAAHSLKGAARIVGLDVIVDLTHRVEDRFVAAQHNHALSSAEIDQMLTATDWLARLQAVPEAEAAAWLATHTPAIEAFSATLSAAGGPPEAQGVPVFAPSSLATSVDPPPSVAPLAMPVPGDEEDRIFDLPSQPSPSGQRERSVRITVARFDQILALASDSLVSARTLTGHADLLERSHAALVRAVQTLEDAVAPDAARLGSQAQAWRAIGRLSASFATQLAEFDLVARANERTAETMYRTVLAGRLRPFSDGITGARRLVRDTARDLGKQVRLDLVGADTRVDRDILEKLEAPISHLLTNAVDHGIESAAERLRAGKTPEATIRIRARHENGRLVIGVRDDGCGIHFEQLRQRIVARGLVTPDTAAGLSDSELLEFLFLPGFSTRENIDTVSGRGVGLNVVQSMVQEAGGSVAVTSVPGEGTLFRLTLPVTRSVIKVLRVQVEGEVYAVPLVRIDRVTTFEPTLPSSDSEGRDAPSFSPGTGPSIDFNGQSIPVVQLASLLGLSTHALPSGPLPVLVCAGIAFAVDKLVDEIELPVRRLDARLGKIPGVSAASLDESGLPLLILDMEDLIQTFHGRPASAAQSGSEAAAPHILIVDDSHTVREMERRLLVRHGYHVTTAQNGQEAWNLLRLNDFDLLISDVDMPQMNGIELVTRVRDNPRLARMPVIMLSYKDREDDRRRGLEAGADFYLTKGDFQNENFRQAVVDLIGPAK